MSKSIGLLLRDGASAVDAEIKAALAEQDFDEIQPGHHTLLRYLGEDGRDPANWQPRPGSLAKPSPRPLTTSNDWA